MADQPVLPAEYVLRLTDEQATFLRLLGRHLRKQDGWWDDERWLETGIEVQGMLLMLDPRQSDGTDYAPGAGDLDDSPEYHAARNDGSDV